MNDTSNRPHSNALAATQSTRKCKNIVYILNQRFLICCRVTLAYQVLQALLDHVDWMGLQDWQGREAKQVSQDPLDHKETGLVE